LIDVLTAAAHEEIERAAGEAAKAAAVAVAREQAQTLAEAREAAGRFEREAARLREGRLALGFAVGGVSFSAGVLAGAVIFFLAGGLSR